MKPAEIEKYAELLLNSKDTDKILQEYKEQGGNTKELCLLLIKKTAERL